MKEKSIKINYIYNVSYQVLLLLTPLITIPYLSRVLGADGIGIVSYAESISSYFTLFATMGITTYGQREISYVQDSRKKRSVVFWNTKLLSFFTSGVILIFYLLFALVRTNSIIYILFAFNILSVTVDITWFFQGMEEFGKIVFRNIIIRVINICFIFSVVRTKNDVILYVLGTVLFLFLGNISLWSYVPRYIDKPDKKDIHPFKDLKIIFSLFIPTIAIQIYTVLDKTMIGFITKNPFESGYYEQALKLSKTVLTLVTSLGTVMIPRIGYFFQQKEEKRLKELVYISYRFVWFLATPLCIGLIFSAPLFVPWFFGSGFESVISLLRLLALLIPVIGISNVTGMQYMITTKKQNLFTTTVVIGAVVNFILNYILIRHYQSFGAAIASVIAEMAVTLIQLFFVRKEISFLRVLKEGKPYFIIGGIMAIVLCFVKAFLKPSIYHTLIMVALGIGVYFGGLILVRDSFFILNLKNIFGKIKRIR